MVRAPLLASLRAWLVFLSLFELPEIHGFLLGDKSLADGFGSGLRDGGAERRLWSAFLACLVLARVAAAFDPRSPTVAVHNAAVHALELAYFYVEKRRYGCDGDEPILAIVAINALVFAALAIAALRGRGQPAPSKKAR